MYIYICIYKFTRNTGAPTPRVGCAPHVVYIYIYIYILYIHIYIYEYMIPMFILHEFCGIGDGLES